MMVAMEKRHSGIGIISFILGLSVPLLFVIAGLDPQLNFSFFLAIAALIPIGFALGIIALFFKDEKQIFSVLGIIINLFWICLIGYVVYDFINHPHWRMF